MKKIVLSCSILMLIILASVFFVSSYIKTNNSNEMTSADNDNDDEADPSIPMLYNEPEENDDNADKDPYPDTEDMETEPSNTIEDDNRIRYNPEYEPDIVLDLPDLETNIEPELFIDEPWTEDEVINEPDTGNIHKTVDNNRIYIPRFSDLGRTVKIACIGDSITAGAGLLDPGTQAYPACLQQELGSTYHVRNFGRGGACISPGGLVPYMQQPEYENARAFNADIYIIMLGTNDANPLMWSEPVYRSEMGSLINSFRSLPSSPTIIMMTAPKSYARSTPENQHILIYDNIIQGGLNPLIKDIARGYGFLTIDMYSFTDGHPEWFPDTVHPDLNGSYQMGKLVAEVIKYY